MAVWSFERSVCWGWSFLVPIAAPAASAASTARVAMSATTMDTQALALPSLPPSSVYVNLPFCRRRCFYCDFPIKVVGDRPGAAAAAAKPYVDNVVREIRATAAAAAIEAPKLPARGGAGGDDTMEHSGRGGGVKTLFFGGGTPSLCPPELVGLLIETVRNCYGIAAGAEISIEMDPGTFDEARLEAFLALGITRVSMGVQSFDAGLLEACGRAHSLADVYQAVELLRKAKVDNFSIDLMSGLPKQTVEQWEHTLSEAIATGAAHISVYDLQVEAGTPFGRWFSPGEAPLPEDETCADMYRTASGVLGQAGYDHYEISNYARPGFQSRHNRAYWENVPFLAFGNGAASFVDGYRFSRPRGLPEYGQWVGELEEEGWDKATGAPRRAACEEVLPGGGGMGDGAGAEESRPSREALERDALLDDVMLGFRLKEGLDLRVVASKYGHSAARRVEEGATEGMRQGWVVRDTAARGSRGGDAGAGGEKGGRNVGRVDDDFVYDGGRGSSSTLGAGSAAGDVGDHGRTSPGRGFPDDRSGGQEDRRAEVASDGGPRGEWGTLRLSDPDGFLFSNSVISSVFCELDGWKRCDQEQDGGVAAADR
ncbi:coproporphyrinogen III oxidase [Ectocarpus siliculosus]|uniref:Radical S-adenosyl methionine domain-containing protein 1, mitochondrial n=1 Tax=Ectocarpus siliculosus TaxID=2880 RepID=D7FRC0_ECTSI|nr:coproporphyrinogen III oxidase [Ectocarpus siliculosus]|eukprot:CBJ30711.1 coproporphyrinogen III oxidase [Ectocarpus siliculosus]